MLAVLEGDEAVTAYHMADWMSREARTAERVALASGVEFELPPSVAVGTSVSGSEFWHGSACSSGARRLSEHHGVSPYCTTEMEGFGTAVALELRPSIPRTGHRREQDALALGICMENVYRVASAILAQLPDGWEQWQHGVPEEMPTPTP